MRTNNRYTLGTFSSDGESVMKKSSPFRNQGFTLITTGFTGTVQFFASNQDEESTPDLSLTADTVNEYSPVQCAELQEGDPIGGATGVIFTTDTSVTRYELNDNFNNYVGVKLSTVSAGSVEVKLDLSDNQ